MLFNLFPCWQQFVFFSVANISNTTRIDGIFRKKIVFLRQNKNV